MRIFYLLPFLIFILSCSAPRALYDYDQEAIFTTYKTYAFYPDLQTGLSQLDGQRLITSIEDHFQQEGLSPSNDPDLYLNVYSEEYRQNNNNSFGVGIGGTGGNVGVGVNAGIPLGGTSTYLRLTFDLIDVETDALVWQAIVESPFNLNASPAARQKRFSKIVQKAFEGYPPSK